MIQENRSDFTQMIRINSYLTLVAVLYKMKSERVIKMPRKENTKQVPTSRKTFHEMRLVVCGKGGSGKSSIVTLMARVLQDKGYKVLVIDGDGSNPGGLVRLMFGSKKGPQPLIEFFGGREYVECPVDDPSPLTRKGDTVPVTEEHIDLAEIPSEYFIQNQETVLFQVGKIQKACEGCDGPMSKVTRDFIVKGEQVTVIDIEAGVEHFGRGIEKNVDIVLVIADPTFESFSIAETVTRLCKEMGIEKVWVILNRVESKEIESVMIQELRKKKVEILGSVHHDPEVLKAGLMGTPIGKCAAIEEVGRIVQRLEAIV